MFPKFFLFSLKEHFQFVFLKEKLITIDSFLPLAIEIKNKVGIKTVFLSNDTDLSIAIDNNIFLKELINENGHLLLYGKAISRRKLLSKIYSISLITLLIVRIFFTKEVIFHFGFFNNAKLRLIANFFRSKIILCGKDPYSSDYVAEYTNIYRNIKKLPNNPPRYIVADAFISFAKKSKMLDFIPEHVTCFALDKIRRGPLWSNLINNSFESLISYELSENNLSKESKIITFIVGHLGCPTLYDEKSFDRNLAVYETLYELSFLSKNYPIALKMHIHSDTELMYSIIKQVTIKSNYKLNFFFTKLHPAILAQRSFFAISNNLSTTFHEFNQFKVPTIEYSFHQEPMLKAREMAGTNDLSTFSVHGNRHELRRIIRDLTYKQPIKPDILENNDQVKKIIDYLYTEDFQE